MKMAENGPGKAYGFVSILIGIIVIVSVTGTALTQRKTLPPASTVKTVEKIAAVNRDKARKISVTLPNPPALRNKMVVFKSEKSVQPTPKRIVPIKPRVKKSRVPATENTGPMSYKVLQLRKSEKPVQPTPKRIVPIKPRVKKSRVPATENTGPIPDKVLQPRQLVSGLHARKLQKTAKSKTSRKHSKAPSAASLRRDTVSQPNSRQSVASGRVLLRMLEHGKGPIIDIAWPETQKKRQKLYRVLRDCYGMTPTLLVKNRFLYSLEKRPGQAWKPDSDRYSGILRSPIGKTIPEEREMFRNIAARHALSEWRPVRIFPRNIDAVMLRGLRKLIGNTYSSATRVRAYYSLQAGRGLFLGSIEVDGGAVAGTVRIPLPPYTGCRI
ncbi:MAG: hypothetical protein VYA17_10260 [Pseudomonadota bacterium]|nr:hypothetical protein [Pseudomonadota bacterium]